MDKIIQIKITLRYTQPVIWRRVLVGKAIIFDAFHHVIQVAMGWTNAHLHEFNVNGVRIGMPLDDFDADFSEGLIDDTTVTLEAMLDRVKQTFNYTYDFGDSWEHAITVEKWLPTDAAITYPLCTGGKLNCPPEDCGSIPGFYNMIHILNDIRHPERPHMLEWLGGAYDATAFDQQHVNRQLAAFFHS
jgi:hypothetical protein